MGILICPVAISGTGKSTLAHKWVRDGLLTSDAIVGADDLRHQLTGDVADQSANNQVFQIVRTMVSTRLSRDLPVYSDQTHLTESARADEIEIAKRHHASIVWLRFTTSWATAVWRNEQRERSVPIEVLERQYDSLQQVDWDALPGNVLDIDSAGYVVA